MVLLLTFLLHSTQVVASDYAFYFKCCAIPRKAIVELEEPLDSEEQEEYSSECVFGNGTTRRTASSKALSSCREKNKIPCGVKYCRRYWK